MHFGLVHVARFGRELHQLGRLDKLANAKRETPWIFQDLAQLKVQVV
jgi:hypothetical protein